MRRCDDAMRYCAAALRETDSYLRTPHSDFGDGSDLWRTFEDIRARCNHVCLFCTNVINDSKSALNTPDPDEGDWLSRYAGAVGGVLAEDDPTMVATGASGSHQPCTSAAGAAAQQSQPRGKAQGRAKAKPKAKRKFSELDSATGEEATVEDSQDPTATRTPRKAMGKNTSQTPPSDGKLTARQERALGAARGRQQREKNASELVVLELNQLKESLCTANGLQGVKVQTVKSLLKKVSARLATLTHITFA